MTVDGWSHNLGKSVMSGTTACTDGMPNDDDATHIWESGAGGCFTEEAEKENAVDEPKIAEVQLKETRTTVFVGHIPYDYTRHELKRELLLHGLHANFVHVPRGRGGKNRGFAFLNFSAPDIALECLNKMSGHMWTRHQTREVQIASVKWATVQGLEANLWARKVTAYKKKVKPQRLVFL